ncbi:hypothetical protein DE146DRAFT_667947 [Phaeosphaeria sp. MPI-PUGE-AT-0046c]|nr:hypothetical protein DE146DRAFT_667947 [Phaeosphaeria sp. MPI-PUGE-AT-0046c]
MQSFDPPRQDSMIQFAVWQRTNNLASVLNAIPLLDVLPNVTVDILERQSTVKRNFVYIASKTSEAPSNISLNITGN